MTKTLGGLPVEVALRKREHPREEREHHRSRDGQEVAKLLHEPDDRSRGEEQQVEGDDRDGYQQALEHRGAHAGGHRDHPDHTVPRLRGIRCIARGRIPERHSERLEVPEDAAVVGAADQRLPLRQPRRRGGRALGKSARTLPEDVEELVKFRHRIGRLDARRRQVLGAAGGRCIHGVRPLHRGSHEERAAHHQRGHDKGLRDLAQLFLSARALAAEHEAPEDKQGAEAREYPADRPKEGGLSPDALREPAENDTSVIGIENIEQVRHGRRVRQERRHGGAPPVSAVVQSLIPE